MKLILGSSSKYRKELLEKAGYVFDVVIPELDEKAIKTADPHERPLLLARAKMDSILPKIDFPAVVIALDIVVVADGKLYEKPESLEEVRRMLDLYRNGLVPETICGIVVVNTETGERYEGVDHAKVYFKHYPDEFIEYLIEEGEMLGRAGSFSIQLMGEYIDRIEGTEDSIIGVPLHLLKDLLSKSGY